ncbi:MAG TPA: hypothetical protein VM784_08550 [Actinomycetota bacterium]|nr:hypothetical protein [Actinomycetota bacterium]
MILRFAMVVVTAGMTLSACGLIEDAKEQARNELIASCREATGASESTCTCAADRLEENISLDAVEDMIDAAARGDIPPKMQQAVKACS